MFESKFILVAEDDPTDIELYQMYFRRLNIARYRILRDGEDVTQYLKGLGQYTDGSEFAVPDLLMLDLSLPRMDGLTVLEWIKCNPDCSVTPTFLLSGSYSPIDIRRAYELGVHACFQKPHSFDGMAALLEVIQRYWQVAIVPKIEAPAWQHV